LRATRERERWEKRLRDEGLALIEQHWIRGVVLRTEIITPRVPKPRYLLEPQTLKDALIAWLEGDRTRFSATGHELLNTGRRHNHPDRAWSRRRARILIVACNALIDDRSINSAVGDQSDVAYRFLRRLVSCLAEDVALVDANE